MANVVPKGAIAHALAHALESAGGWVLLSDAGDRPDLLCLCDRGVIAVDIDLDSSSATDVAPLKRLNVKLSQLIEDIPELDDLRLHRFVLRPGFDGPRESFSLGRADIADEQWFRQLPRYDIPISLSEAIRARLAPAVSFQLEGRGRLLDHGRAERANLRVTLDHRQASTALRSVRDVLVVRGPAGSGKSLILSARARWLSEEHPTWRIQMLCYNNALVPYLRSLVDDCPNVSVTTFGKYAYGNGHHISLDDEATARRDLDRVRARIDLAVDALLIDEWQDFLPAWTQYALEAVFPGRGGTVIVGDERQSLYRDGMPVSGLEGHTIEEVDLRRPYRSTKQILQVVKALDPSFEVEGWAHAPDGEPVELIWAESVLEQARAVAWDLAWFGKEGRPWSDMGVLVTQKWMFKTVARALHEREIPHETIARGQASTFDLRSDRVKLLTVHSAKGLEFGVTALLGLENLKDPSDPSTPLVEKQDRARTARIGLVGPTRASDLLILTYTRPNVFIERLRRSEAPYHAWTWPDDYASED